MTTGVVLSGALRPTVTNLSRIERTIEDVTLRLASGLKVNSALDNPQNFFAARSLNEKANDLSRRIDGINQNIFAVKEADIGLKTIIENIEQAEALALEALGKLREAETIAFVEGTVDLSNVGDITSLAGVTAGQTFDVIAGDGNGGTRTATFTITAQSGGGFAARIGALEDASGNDLGLEAKLSDEGFIQIRSTTGDFFRIQTATGSADDATMDALGLGYYADQFGNLTALADNEIRSQKLYTVATGREVSLDDHFRIGAISPIIVGENGRTFDNIRSVDLTSTDSYFIGINDAPILEPFFFYDNEQGTPGEASSIGRYIDRINDSTVLGPLIEASLEDGQIVIRRKSSEITHINMRVFESGGNNLETAFGFGTGVIDQSRGSANLDSSGPGLNNTSTDSLIFGSVPPEIVEQYEKNLADIQQSIDDLVNDANYRGINLLKGENMTTIFNEDGSSRLVSEGQDLSTNGLGISNIKIDNEFDAEDSLGDIRLALLQAREYGRTLANDLAILQSRSDFIRENININKAGADDLTVADANEEGANLLALQTRQALGVTALSIGAQSSQSVLRLF